LDGYFECASVWRARCSHCVTFDKHNLCRHPDAALILERSV
jgi:hypothetical protein